MKLEDECEPFPWIRRQNVMDGVPTQPHGRSTLARTGFSVTELLLVIAVLGVVITMAMPSVGRSLASVRADRTAAVVASDLKLAFSLASKQNSPTRLRVHAAERWYEITDRATPQQLLVRTLDGNAGEMALGSLTSTRAWIDVFPNGLASHPLAITVEIGVQRRVISMTRTGHVKVTAI